MRQLYIWLFVALFFSPSLAFGWARNNVQPFPGGEATVILDRFCLNTCDSLTQSEWHTLIRRAIGEWNNAGANFFFDTRAARSSDDPCYPPQGTVSVIFTDNGQLCPGDGRIPSAQNGAYAGAAATAPGYGVVYIFFREERFVGNGVFLSTHSLLLHEFGHIVGLDHPDKYGQDVSAIMNSDGNYARRVTAGTLAEFVGLEPDDIAGIRALYGTRAGQGSLQAALEAPAQGQTLTGIGLLRGWACEAERVEVSINNGPRLPASIGGPRGDTAEVCGHPDTGFVLLVNWNEFGAGEHRLDLFIDSRRHTSRTVEVVTYGQAYRDDLDGAEWVLEDWPEPGTDTTIGWNEDKQNIEILDIQRSHVASCQGWDGSQWDRTNYGNILIPTEWVQGCLDAGADPNARNRHGETPLHTVAWYSQDNAEAVRLLIAHGANVNARSNGNSTPLHSAASWPDNYQIVVALLEAGADVNAKTDNGATPLDYHVNYGLDPRIGAALRSAGGVETESGY